MYQMHLKYLVTWPVQMLVTHHLLQTHLVDNKYIHIYIYIMHFWSYNINTILFSYLAGGIGFHPPLVEHILYLCTIYSSCM